jgi:hypothetical protein
MDGLPGTATRAEQLGAEECLLGFADQLGPAGLRVCGTELAERLTLISEDGDPPRDDVPASRVTLRPRGGGWALSGWLQPHDGALLAATLDTHLDQQRRRAHTTTDTAGGTAPLLPGGLDPADGGGWDAAGVRAPSREERRAVALLELLTVAATAPDPAPGVGPLRPQVTVLIPMQTLTERLDRAGMLDTGQAMSPALARRLACDADLIPAVLGGKSQILDVGRTTRVIPTGLRAAVGIRDGGCTFPGCDRPPGRCHAHHITHWADGGPTDYENLTLVCSYHHHLVHDQHWQINHDDHGLPVFTPPPTIDPLQRPRQHHRYHLRQ